MDHPVLVFVGGPLLETILRRTESGVNFALCPPKNNACRPCVRTFSFPRGLVFKVEDATLGVRDCLVKITCCDRYGTS